MYKLTNLALAMLMMLLLAACGNDSDQQRCRYNTNKYRWLLGCHG